MLPVDHLVAFTLTAFVLIAVPGPSVLFVISRSLVLGRLAGLATVVGNATGVYIQMLAIAFGLGAIVERSVEVYTLVKLAGAAYLVYLGVQALRHRGKLAAALDPRVEAKATRRIFLDAFAVGVANPKAMVFFAAMLPQFVDRASGHVPLQMMFLGAVFFLVALVSDGTWALAAGAARTWLSASPRRLELVGGTAGLAMVGIGARLALSGRHD
ncbi:LysE family translocator [Nocardioides sp.]|jgi:threonine/homoserine/homoserine lactone efflux protein|uniref:LysE family translocator n=1 Tax=Nocardioides sp. TaxID=35761 RepID=UPI002C0D1345|nr:LysE family translocator [Nocardioides sp.]HVX55972.1 LysE family translocator [Nocardioides sp.]